MDNQKTIVLVVDDEQIDIEVIRGVLESAGGFTIFEANGYDAALQVFESVKNEIDLLITDVSMPRRTGIDLATALLQKQPTLRVLFTSGWVGAEILQSTGITEWDRFFLPKPFHTADLLAVVRKTLDSPDSFRITKGIRLAPVRSDLDRRQP